MALIKRGTKGIWRRNGRPNWFAWIGGKQVNLGTPHRSAALQEWHRLNGTEPRRKPARQLFVTALLEQFLEHLDETDSPYHGWYKSRVDSFAHAIPARLLLSDLTPKHVTHWMHLHPKWSSTHKAGSISAVQRALNWHLEEGTIRRNPLAKVRKPARRRREFTFTPEQLAALLEALPGKVRTFVELLAATGCRPSEMARARGVDVAPDGATIAVRRSKTGALDPIPIPARLRPAVLALAEAAGDGWLCKSERGSQFHRNIWAREIQAAREVAKLPKGADAYALRHTWITERLTEPDEKKRLSVADVALATRTSIAMISKVYAHLLGERTRGLADKLD